MYPFELFFKYFSQERKFRLTFNFVHLSSSHQKLLCWAVVFLRMRGSGVRQYQILRLKFPMFCTGSVWIKSSDRWLILPEFIKTKRFQWYRIFYIRCPKNYKVFSFNKIKYNICFKSEQGWILKYELTMM